MTRVTIDLTRSLTTDWRESAACAEFPNQLFFPPGDENDANTDRAMAICDICTVREDCLEYALETNQRSGIWGGTSEDQRRSLRRKWLAGRRRTS